MGVGEVHLLFVVVLVLSLILFLYSLGDLVNCITHKDRGQRFECTKYLRISENKFMYFFGSLVLSSLLAMMMTTYYAKSEFLSILNVSQLEVVVDGVRLSGEDKNIFLSDSLKIYTRKGRSGSRPASLKKVNLSYKNARHNYYYYQDSRDGNIYWVYLPSDVYKINLGFVKISITI